MNQINLEERMTIKTLNSNIKYGIFALIFIL